MTVYAYRGGHDDDEVFNANTKVALVVVAFATENTDRNVQHESEGAKSFGVSTCIYGNTSTKKGRKGSSTHQARLREPCQAGVASS